VTRRGKAAARNNAMQMWVEGELARPGVEHSGDAEAASETLWVIAEGEQRTRGSRKKQVKEVKTVGTSERTQRCGQGEDDVKIGSGQNALDTPLDPMRLCQALTFWAVAVAAGIVGRSLEATTETHVEMSAQGLCAASLDGAHDFELVTGQSVAPAICLPVRPEDIGDLDEGTLRRYYSRGFPLAEQVDLPGGHTSLLEPIERTWRLADVLDADLGIAGRGPD
jgi:hypothetical protein